jgi:hydroxyacylglutathione hydrolase
LEENRENHMLSIVMLTLGPVQTNAYLVADDATKVAAAVIDPAAEGHLILDEAARRNWRITNIWLTHAHFDHLAGAAAVADGSSSTTAGSTAP